MADFNRKAIELLADVRNEYEAEETKIVISGCVGPRGDGHVPSAKMSAEAAQDDYHNAQIEVFRDSDADMIAAITMKLCGGGHRHRASCAGGWNAIGNLFDC